MHNLNLIFLVLAGVTHNLNSPAVEELIRRGLEYSYRMEYGRSRECFEEVVTREPDNPAGYFFQAALLQVYMLDFATGANEAEFYRYLNQAIQKSQKILAVEDNPWAHFYLGAAHIYRAPYEGWRRRYLTALAEGLKSEPELRRALALDSTLADAGLGLGSLDYFKARANRYVLGLKLFGDAGRGIGTIRKAAERGRYFSVTARHSLAWTLTADGRPAEAKPLTLGLVERYPENRVFLWQLVDIDLALKDYPAALDAATRLYDNVSANQPGCCANLAQVKLKMAEASYGAGDYTTAARLCEEIRQIRERPDQAIGFRAAVAEAEKLFKKVRLKL